MGRELRISQATLNTSASGTIGPRAESRGIQDIIRQSSRESPDICNNVTLVA